MVEHNTSNFIRNIVIDDVESGKTKEVITRFPPEPNGYLHIGHAKSIVLNFDIADEFGGKTNLRFDDTNPVKEDVEFVESIKKDVEWLGYNWDGLFFASDYFEEMYSRAILLIEKGLAYVDDLSADQIREYRGTLTEPGKESPFRGRSVEENLDLFKRMRDGEFERRRKSSSCQNRYEFTKHQLRDPVIYRIAHVPHHNTGTNGASIQCMRSLTQLRMRLKALLILFVHLNSRTSVHSMTGSLKNAKWQLCQDNMSSVV